MRFLTVTKKASTAKAQNTSTTHSRADIAEKCTRVEKQLKEYKRLISDSHALLRQRKQQYELLLEEFINTSPMSSTEYAQALNRLTQVETDIKQLENIHKLLKPEIKIEAFARRLKKLNNYEQN